MTIAQYNPNYVIHAFVRIYYIGGFYNTSINYSPFSTLKEAIQAQIGEGTIYSVIDEFNNTKNIEIA